MARRIIFDTTDIIEKTQYVKDQIGSLEFFDHVPSDILSSFSAYVESFFSNIIELPGGTTTDTGDYIIRHGVGGDFKLMIAAIDTFKADVARHNSSSVS